MGVTKTQVVKFIRKGEAGENGISIFVLPASLTAKLGTANIYKVQIALYDGGVQIPYNDPDNGNMLCSTLPSSYKYKWNFAVDNGKFYYRIITSPTELGLMTIPFTVTYKDATYDSVINIQVVKDGDKGEQGDKGDKGEQGAVLRGPQAWSDCATGYAFRAGGTGEKWQDVVIYGDNYYSCKKSHTKTASNYPGSTTDTNNGYWQLGDKVELVATKILLSTYALVKNLGVEAIDMKDANGKILFQAKDGAVTCKTGTFENVNITGNLTVSQLKYMANMTPDGSVNRSFIFGGGNYVMPQLSTGEFMRITLFNPVLTRLPNPTVLTGNVNVVFLKGGENFFTDTKTTVTLVGWHEFIGFGMNDEKTLWLYQTIYE